MKNQILITLSALTAACVLSACGSSSSSNNNPAVTNASQCGYGTGYSPQYQQCLQVSPNNPNCGILPQSGQCVSIVSNPLTTNPYANTTTIGAPVWTGRLQITNPSLYKQFLQEYGFVCNQNAVTWMGDFNWGYQDCNNWGNSASLIIALAQAVLPSAGFATVNVQTNFNFGAYGAQVPVTLNGQFLATNNNTAFEMQSYGYYGSFSYNALINVSLQGKPTDPSHLAFLSYRGGQFATANVTH